MEYEDGASSIRRQSALLQINRSSLYYTKPVTSERDIELLNAIDKIHTDNPCYGYRRIHAKLNRDGYAVGEDHVITLMKELGIEAIYPHKRTSIQSPDHKVYPYLLKDIKASFPDHIWAYDITYIRMLGTWMYLCAVLDWYSRYIVGWSLSERMNIDIVLDTWNMAFETNRVPLYSNSDQGSQMTASKVTGLIESKGVLISMDHKGRCFDNIFTERLWRTIKYEEVYIKDYNSPKEARINIDRYIKYYNNERLHSSLEYNTPNEIYNVL